MKSVEECIQIVETIMKKNEDCIIQLRLANIWTVDFDIDIYYKCLNVGYDLLNFDDIIMKLYPTFADDWLHEIIPREKGEGFSFQLVTPPRNIIE